jgi:hypothetical protein
MKKLSIPCSFGAEKHKVDFYIGKPKEDNHPIQSQSNWLSSERGGNVTPEIMESLNKLHDLSKKNHVPFEELCSYAIDVATVEKKEAKPEAIEQKTEEK